MLNNQQVQLSKFLSLILRHNPSVVGLELDPEGWVDTKQLIDAINRTPNHSIDMELLQHIVAHNNKNRFGFNQDQTRIRANQGHSLDINLGYDPIQPPEYLYHRANTQSVQKFLTHGIQSKHKKHAYMGASPQEAHKFGHWRGQPVLLRIHAQRMHQDGFQFYHSQSGIWLTEKIPPKYIERISQSESHQKDQV